MRDWHLGQRDRPARRGDRLDVCGSGNRCPPVKSGGSATELSPIVPERCGDRSSMPTRRYESLINFAHFPIFNEAFFPD
jgi:hypothetical protein